MALHTAAVGATSPSRRLRCDERWTMAYAAGLGLADPRYLDPSRRGGVVAHPVFPVAPEWDLLVSGDATFDYGLDPGESSRGVHAGHDLVLHRPLRPPFDANVTVSVAGIERTTAGARLTLSFDAVDDDGAPLWTTRLVSLYRGVDVAGDDVAPTTSPLTAHPPLPTDATVSDQRSIALHTTAAHVYTECARIWNPIHTDTRVARAAGLDDIILHGTATLALGVTAAAEMAGAHATDVRRLGGSFRSMVTLPSTITVELVDAGDAVRFAVRNEAGELAVRDGFLELHERRFASELPADDQSVGGATS